MKTLMVVMLGLGLTSVTITTAEAQICDAGCSSQVRACVKTARTDARGCRTVCRDQESRSEIRSCVRDCNATLRDGIKTCRNERGDCVDSCDAVAASTANCLGSCGIALGSCQHSVASDQTQCILECRTGSDKAGCVGACRDAAADGRQGCLDAATACRATCGGTATTSTTEPVATTSTTQPVATTSTSQPAATTTTSQPAPTTTTTLPGSPSAAFLQ